MDDEYHQPLDCGEVVTGRISRDGSTVIRLASGGEIRCRRFVPIGKGDLIRCDKKSLQVLARADREWIDVQNSWTKEVIWSVADRTSQVIFKEIETEEEYQLFDDLRKFHYRGGGGAGRTVPIIAVTSTWDLPRVLGFLEISSSMIANTARKTFFSFPYWESGGNGWQTWNRAAAKKYSSMIARISRFVIHPEIRGLGLANHFLTAAVEFAGSRWHYGGYRPRFLEITADMLRYYPFTSNDFYFLGETEGNEHRLSKDMKYLIKKALAGDGVKSMPQRGGGVMTMQRSYASQLIAYMKSSDRPLSEVLHVLQHDPARLDQVTWEALHKVSRHPKPCYAAGVTDEARTYLRARSKVLEGSRNAVGRNRIRRLEPFVFEGVSVDGHADIGQTNDCRRIQDAFGFVGSSLDAEIVPPISFELGRGEVTLICGASGSGKTALTRAVRVLCCDERPDGERCWGDGEVTMRVKGNARSKGRVVELEEVEGDKLPLEQVGDCDLKDFIEVCAQCGLAEPQLFVRPAASLSSGQRYRFQVAKAFLAAGDIVSIDNFCESLDVFTSEAVCKGVRKLAARMSVSVVVATAAYDRVRMSLKPHQTILLRRGNRPVVEKQ